MKYIYNLNINLRNSILAIESNLFSPLPVLDKTANRVIDVALMSIQEALVYYGQKNIVLSGCIHGFFQGGKLYKYII